MTETTLMLRTCKGDMTSYEGFKWPEEGWVSCPDWNPSPVCGGGLHGFLMGEGNGGLIDWEKNTRWLICEIYNKEIVDLGDKIKVPRAKVIHVGTQRTATDYLLANGAAGKKVIGCTLEGGDGSTLTGGCGSVLTGGDMSILTGGNWSKIVGGDGATIVGGYRSALIGGDDSTLIGGDDSTLTGGYGSTLTGGKRSTLTGGNRSILVGGDGAVIVGGYESILTGGEGSILSDRGYESTLTGGDGAILIFSHCEGTKKVVVVIGKDDFKPNVPYKLNEHNIPVEV
jgi:hypothetical protein